MKDIESLKREQAETKSKLVDVIELINSEEYYGLTPSEKSIIAQQRLGLEIYLGSLTKQVYDKDNCSFDASTAMWPLLMSSIFTGPSGFGSSSSLDPLKKQLDENDFKTKEENFNGEQIYTVPV